MADPKDGEVESATSAKGEVDKAVNDSRDRPAMYVMRHGKTALDLLKRSDGWLDFPLTDEGRRGLLPAQRYLKDLPTPVSDIFASSLRRTMETAHIIKSGMGVDPPEIVDHEALHPWNLGKELIGAKKKEARPIVKFFMRHPDKTPEGGESMNAFRKRFIPWIEREMNETHDGPFLFVLSGSNIREISMHIAGDRDIFDIDEGGLIAFKPVGGMWAGTIVLGGKNGKDEDPAGYGS